MFDPGLGSAFSGDMFDDALGTVPLVEQGRKAAGVDVSLLSPDELVAGVLGLEEARRLLDAAEGHLLAELDKRPRLRPTSGSPPVAGWPARRPCRPGWPAVGSRSAWLCQVGWRWWTRRSSTGASAGTTPEC
jgi:hypothetical protein